MSPKPPVAPDDTPTPLQKDKGLVEHIVAEAERKVTALMAEHDRYQQCAEFVGDGEVCLNCGASHGPHDVRLLVAQVSRLREALDESNSVCACGCPESEHENYGEDGKACEHEDHQCVRTNRAVLAMLTDLRASLTIVNESVPIHGMSDKDVRAIAGMQRDLRAQLLADSKQWRLRAEQAETTAADAKSQNERLVADVSRLQQENALLKRSLSMLTKQLEQKEAEWEAQRDDERYRDRTSDHE